MRPICECAFEGCGTDQTTAQIGSCGLFERGQDDSGIQKWVECGHSLRLAPRSAVRTKQILGPAQPTAAFDQLHGIDAGYICPDHDLCGVCEKRHHMVVLANAEVFKRHTRRHCASAAEACTDYLEGHFVSPPGFKLVRSPTSDRRGAFLQTGHSRSVVVSSLAF